MPHFPLRYELAPDYLERRSALRDDHSRLAWAAADRGQLLRGGGFAKPVDTALLLFKKRRRVGGAERWLRPILM